MEVSKKQSYYLQSAIEKWQKKGLLTDAKADELRDSISEKKFDWKLVARYSFWTALASAFISLASLLADDYVIELAERLMQTSDYIFSIFFFVASGACYFWAWRIEKRKREKKLSIEFIVVAASLLLGGALIYLLKSFDKVGDFPAWVFLLCALLWGVMANIFLSASTWLISLVSLYVWFGLATYNISEDAWSFLGMNYSLRFVIFSLLLFYLGYFIRFWVKFKFYTLTRYFTLSAFFVAFWLLSIFGNYTDFEVWEQVRQENLYYWGIIFGLVAIAFIIYGVKKDDDFARAYGISFLLLNIYTRYFEFFWEESYKAIFFAILAVSFWLIGRKAERLWNMDFRKK
jgi:MFS family permease